jgi:RHS repeat-associated protein
MTDSNGALVWDAVYRPFGEAHAITGTATNNQRFPGQLYDPETGFHYNYFRDYAPGLGRYAESDPIGLEAGVNTFAYADANPISLTDPLGLEVYPLPDDQGLPPTRTCLRFDEECFADCTEIID